MTTKFLIFNFQFLLLFLIVVLGAFLRFYNLPGVPPSASVDEVSTGYNAYSILKTGADEYGTKFPIILRSYDDWQPALYAYIMIPFIKIFGLNLLSIRLPGAILSVITLVACYYLVLELFKNRNVIISSQKINSKIIALFATLLLAISPWHIYISRIGFPTNAGLTFLVLGILFLLKRKFFLSPIFFALAFMSYHTEKIFIPILLLIIVLIFRKELFKAKKKVIVSFLIGFIILLPFLKETFAPSALSRFKATNISSANASFTTEKSIYLAKIVGSDSAFNKVFYDRKALVTQMVIQSYLSHFNPEWLFTNISNDKHKIPGIGLLYVWEIPLVLAGLYILLSHNFDVKKKLFILAWFLAAPVAASITTDAPHALRTHVFLPTWQIFSALGLYYIFLLTKNKRIFSGVFVLILTGTIYYLYVQYFSVFPKVQSASFQYPISQAVPLVLENENSFKKIVFSNEGNLYQSYMYFLFYSKYDPVLYQREGGTGSGGFAQTHKFGKFEFRHLDYKEDFTNKETLFIGNLLDFPEKAKTKKIVNFLDDKPAIKIVTPKDYRI